MSMYTAYNVSWEAVRVTSLMPSAQTAYSDLLTSLFSSAIPDRGISCFTRNVKGKDYWYQQHTVGSSKRSRYIGPDTDDIRQLVAKCRHRQDDDKQQHAGREQLVAICVASGLHAPPPAETRVYEVLAQAGLFEAGAVISGTHAFLHIGNMLCVDWARDAGQTDDIAQAQTIIVASPPVDTDIRETLIGADKGVLAVAALEHGQPSTRFSLRNRELIVNLQTPMRGRPTGKPVLLKGLNAAAEPVRDLDYLIEDSQLVAVAAGTGLLIRVPDPARFALHKLVGSQRRPAADAADSRKDLAQAAAVLDVLNDLRPGDIDLAGEAALPMGNKFVKQMLAAASLLDEELGDLVRAAAPGNAIRRPASH